MFTLPHHSRSPFKLQLSSTGQKRSFFVGSRQPEPLNGHCRVWSLLSAADRNKLVQVGFRNLRPEGR